MQLGSGSTGIDLIIIRSHCYPLVSPPFTLFLTHRQPRRRVARARMTRSAEVGWADGWVGWLARGLVRPVLALLDTPPQPSTSYFRDFVPAQGLLTGSWVSGFGDHQVETDLYSSRSTLAGH